MHEPFTKPQPARSAVRALFGRLSALSVLYSKSILCGGFVWARRAFNRQKWWFPAGQFRSNTFGYSKLVRRNVSKTVLRKEKKKKKKEKTVMDFCNCDGVPTRHDHV
jgi:hypothetical protein